MPHSVLQIADIERAVRHLGLSGSVNDHVAMHQALTHMGIWSSLHHFRANCAQGTVRHIITGVALEVREGVFLLTGERGWNDIRSKLAVELGAQLKDFAFSHHCIQSEPPPNAEGKIQTIVGFFKNQTTESV